MKTVFLSALCALLVFSCTASKEASETATKAVEALVADNYEIVSTWANPVGSSAIKQLGAQGALGMDSNAGRINITGNTNYVRKVGDTLLVYLPYYGTRTTGATPLMETTNSSIIFEGIPSSYTVLPGRKGAFTQVSFSFGTDSDRYNFLVKVFTNNSVTMDVTTANKSRIQYEGTIGRYTPKL